MIASSSIESMDVGLLAVVRMIVSRVSTWLDSDLLCPIGLFKCRMLGCMLESKTDWVYPLYLLGTISIITFW